MLFCLFLWHTVAAKDCDVVILFMHLSRVDTNSSCPIASLTRTDGGYSLAVGDTLTESGDHWCYEEATNDTELIETTHKNKKLACSLKEPEQAMFIRVPCEKCWLHGVDKSSYRIFNARRFKASNYTTLAFAPSTQRLYFCSYLDIFHLGYTDLDGAYEKILVKNIYCYGLAVDDLNSFVFFVGFARSTDVVSRLTDDGYDIVKKLSWRPNCISVHPPSKKLFVGGYSKIMSFDYNGKHRKHLGRGSGIFALAVNPSGDVLYYGTTRKAYELRLSTMKKYSMPVKFPIGWNGAKYMVYAYERVIFSNTHRQNVQVVIFDPTTSDCKFHKLRRTVRAPLFIVRECKTKP